MINMDIEEIKREIASFDAVEFVGGVSEDLIREAESTLHLRFPPSYRSFLLELGSGSISSEEFIGLGGEQHLDVVFMTNSLRNRNSSRLPHGMIPIRNDGYGNYDCINTSKITENEECEIIEFVHGADSVAHRRLASSFSDWFSDMLKLIRRIDAEDEMDS